MFKKFFTIILFCDIALSNSYAVNFNILDLFTSKKTTRTQSEPLPETKSEKKQINARKKALKKMIDYFYDCSGGVEHSAGSKNVFLISSGAVGMNSFGYSKIAPGIVEINSFNKKSVLKNFCSNIHSKTMGLYMISWPEKQEWQASKNASVENIIDYLKLFSQAGATVKGVVLDMSMFQTCSFCKKRIVYNNQNKNDDIFIFVGLNENEKFANDPKNKRKSLGFLSKPCSLQNFTQTLENRLVQEKILVPIFVSSDEVIQSILKFM